MITDRSVDGLASAISALKLRDIVLYEARFSRPTASQTDVAAVQRVKRTVQFARGDVEEGGRKINTLQVVVGLGVRITGLDGVEAPVYVEIEADFIADYEILSDISDEAAKAFATFNSVHNVWPFWRQHVFDIVQRARLNPIQVPLFTSSSDTANE